MSRGVECFGRAGGVEYAAAGPVTVPPLEAAMSLARNLGTDVPTAGAMLMRADAGDASETCAAIEQRNRELRKKRRNRRLTGPQALVELMEKRFAPGPVRRDVAMLRERPEAPRRE